MTTISPLKQAFARARSCGNIDEILQVLLSAKLFAVCKRVLALSSPVFYVQRSPNPERWCVTVAETADALSSIADAELVEYTGQELLQSIDKSHEIVVVYDDGGDYLTREQLDFFRS
jgi:fimbrial chaperone protein